MFAVVQPRDLPACLEIIKKHREKGIYQIAELDGQEYIVFSQQSAAVLLMIKSKYGVKKYEAI